MRRFEFLIGVALQFTVFTSDFANRVTHHDFISTFQFWAINIVAGAVAIMMVAFFQISLFKTTQTLDRGSELNIFEIYHQSWPLCGPYLSIFLLVLVRVVLWSLLLVVPGIIFGSLYSLANIIFLIDGKNGIEALRESKKIIKAYWGRYFGNLILMFLAISLVCKIADFLLASTFGVNDIAGEFNILAAVGEGLFYMFVIVLSIFPSIFVFYLYNDLKQQMGPS